MRSYFLDTEHNIYFDHWPLSDNLTPSAFAFALQSE